MSTVISKYHCHNFIRVISQLANFYPFPMQLIMFAPIGLTISDALPLYMVLVLY